MSQSKEKYPTYLKENKVVDFLTEDPPIQSQKFCCVSCLEPLDKQREQFVEELSESNLDIPKKHISKVIKEYIEFEKGKRGFKVRGSYDNVDTVKKKAGTLRNYEPDVHIFIGEVGKWLPFSPNPEDIEDENFQEQQLNETMKKYIPNPFFSIEFLKFYSTFIAVWGTFSLMKYTHPK